MNTIEKLYSTIYKGRQKTCLYPSPEGKINWRLTMKKEIKKTVIASILALGLFAGPAFAQTSGTSQPQQQMGGNMMGMQGQGMMGGNQGNWGKNQGNWDGMGCNGMMGGAMMNHMTPVQQQTFMNQTTGLRQEMIKLRSAYAEAMRNPATDPKELAKIEKQMLAIRSQMMDEMENLPTN
jgi:hypothetical protein